MYCFFKNNSSTCKCYPHNLTKLGTCALLHQFHFVPLYSDFLFLHYIYLMTSCCITAKVKHFKLFYWQCDEINLFYLKKASRKVWLFSFRKSQLPLVFHHIQQKKGNSHVRLSLRTTSANVKKRNAVLLRLCLSVLQNRNPNFLPGPPSSSPL